MRDLALAVIVFACLPLILWRPAIGILMWSWLSYMNPHRLAYGFAYTFPFAMWVACVTLVGLLFTKERKPIPWTPATVVWLAFVVWTCVTTLFALNPEDAANEWQRMIKIQLMTLLTLVLINTRERIQALVWVLAFSIGFYGIKGGLFTLLTGGSYRVVGPPDTFIEDNNAMALALVMVLPLLIYLYRVVESRRIKLAVLGCTLACALAVLGSHSRGGLLAGAAMLLALWLRSRKKLTLAVALLLVLSPMIAFMPEQWSARMHTIGTYEKDASAMGRINAWGFAVNLANDRPVVGGGFQSFSVELFRRYAPNPEDHHDAHSIYFEVLAEQGYVGLFLFVTLLFTVLLLTRRLLLMAQGRDDLRWAGDLASALQVSLVAYAVGGAFLGLAYFDLFYHLVALAIVTFAAVQKTLAEAPASADVDVDGVAGATIAEPLWGNDSAPTAGAVPSADAR